MNNISDIRQNYVNQALLNETADKPRTDAQAGQAPDNTAGISRDDKVSLSQASKEMQLVKTAVAESPDIRTEKVAELKQAIMANQYSIDPNKVAEAIIGSIVSEVV